MNLRDILKKHKIYSMPKGKVSIIGREMYHVPSRGRRHITHTVDLETNKCDCEDHRLGKNSDCFHIRFCRAMREAKIIS